MEYFMKFIFKMLFLITLFSLLALSFFTFVIAPDLRSEYQQGKLKSLYIFKNTCHLDYETINNSSFFKERGIELDCSKILMLDKYNSPVYKMYRKVIPNSYLKNDWFEDSNDELTIILNNLSFSNTLLDLNSDGIVTKKEYDKYMRNNDSEPSHLLDHIYSIDCDRFNITLNYCDYDEFKKNFSKDSNYFMMDLLRFKSISHKILK